MRVLHPIARPSPLHHIDSHPPFPIPIPPPTAQRYRLTLPATGRQAPYAHGIVGVVRNLFGGTGGMALPRPTYTA